MSNQEAGQDFPGEYRLDVKDFGPIAHASVDLRPLTIFIGPSNTGEVLFGNSIVRIASVFW